MIVRPFNVLIGAASVLLGALVSTTSPPVTPVLLACISAALVMAGGNAINDYHDADIDRLNKPSRPIPAGQVSRVNAQRLAIILFVLGVFLSIFLSWECFVIAVFAAGGLILYSARLKKTFLWGNVVVSWFTAMSFIYGGLAAGAWHLAVIPAVFAFLFHLGREIIKDVEDQAADREASARTLPIQTNVRYALVIITIVFCLLIGLTFVPYFLKIYNLLYLIAVVIGVDLVVTGVIYSIWRNASTESMRRASLILKFDMIFGLLAIYLGSLGSG